MKSNSGSLYWPWYYYDHLVFDWFTLKTYDKEEHPFFVRKFLEELHFDWLKFHQHRAFAQADYALRFSRMSDEELVAVVERQSNCRGWGQERSYHDSALKDECDKRGIACDFVVDAKD